jgi:hypothetical protein
VKVGIELLNITTKGYNNCCTGDPVEYIKPFFCKAAHQGMMLLSKCFGWSVV